MEEASLEEKLILLYVTCPDESSAQQISVELLNSKFAACTNRIKGLQSTYWWEGKIEFSEEILLIIKTRFTLSASCQNLILKHHPYSLPCILELPVEGGHPAYLKWLYAETAPNSREP